MSTIASIEEALRSAITNANDTTEAQDTNVTDAINTLISGYGGGSGGADVNSLADGTYPSGALEITGTTIKPYAFYGKTGITSVSAPNYAGHTSNNFQFAQCTGITSVSFPSMVTGCASMFYGCTGLTSITDEMFPAMTDAYGDIFNGCAYVTSVKLSNMTGVLNKTNRFRQMSRVATIDLPKYQTVAQYDFYQDAALTTIKLGKNSTATTRTINANAFSGCAMLTDLVLYGDVVWTLSNISAFLNSPFASGKAGGTLYVPSAMISSYQSASNWSTILGYTNNSIAAIEGSDYE